MSEQLQLDLDWGREPWQGISPRYLTRAPLKRTLSKPATVDEIYMDPAQLMFEFFELDPSVQGR